MEAKILTDWVLNEHLIDPELVEPFETANSFIREYSQIPGVREYSEGYQYKFPESLILSQHIGQRKLLIGEFGGPIPDIHGDLDEKEQSVLIKKTLDALLSKPRIMGINYWTGFGGTTSLWREDFSEKTAVELIEKYYKPDIMFLTFSSPTCHFFKAIVGNSSD